MKKDKPIAYSLASYHTKDGPTCDLKELAKKLSSIGNVPERINFIKAGEISLLARAFLILYKNNPPYTNKE